MPVVALRSSPRIAAIVLPYRNDLPVREGPPVDQGQHVQKADGVRRVKRGIGPQSVTGPDRSLPACREKAA